jgi:excisionase family DNA binding protein
MEPMLLKPDEVAQALAIGRSKAYALISDGIIPSVRLQGAVRVPVDLLRAWITKQVKAAPEEGTTG